MPPKRALLLSLLIGCGPSQDQFDALQAQVDENADDIQVNTDDIAALETEVAVLDTRVDALEQTLANAAGGDLVALGDAIADVAADLDVAEASLTALQTSMTTAEGDIDGLETDVNALQTDVAEAQTDIDDLQSQSGGGGGTLEADVLALTDRVDALEVHAGNDAWRMSGNCGCNIASGSNWTSLSGATLAVTLDKAGPLLLVASSSAGSADGYYRLKVTQLTGGAWSATTPEVKVESGLGTSVVSMVDVVTPPGAATYQVSLEARGSSITSTYAIAAVQLTEAP